VVVFVVARKDAWLRQLHQLTSLLVMCEKLRDVTTQQQSGLIITSAKKAKFKRTSRPL